MLHIRVVTTPGLTGRLLGRLEDLPGLRNLIVHEGAARPSGDAIFSTSITVPPTPCPGATRPEP